jgi:hypothetical protein
MSDANAIEPCQAQATFMCETVATVRRLRPAAMLSGSTTPATYVPMCLPCYEHLADAYVKEVHAR